MYISNPNAMKLFSDRGILTKESPFEVTEASDVVITMLPSPKHVRFDSIFNLLSEACLGSKRFIAE